MQIAIGVGALLWGPASDKFGRKPILLIATGLFALTNVPLMLTPNIGLLIAFRTLQVSQTSTTTVHVVVFHVCVTWPLRQQQQKQQQQQQHN